MSTLVRIARMPWLATIRSPQGFLFVFIWFMLAVDVGKALPVEGAARQFGIALLLTALATVWKCVTNTLWLARDARALRLPGIEHDADRSLAVFFCASVVVPALVLGAIFGHALLWCLCLALVALGTLAFCILPTGLTLPLFFCAIVATIALGWRPPMPGNPEFLRWAVPALVVLAVASLQRWAAIRRAVTFDWSPLLRPTAAGGRSVQLRKLRGEGYRATDSGFGGKRNRCMPDQLNRVGPGHPVRSLRTALGRLLMPMDAATTPARFRRMQLLFAVLVSCLPALAALASHYFGAAAIVTFSPQLLLLMAIAMTAASFNHQPCAMRWSGHHAELPLLALLPRLDAPARIRQHTLAACLARGIAVKLLFAASIALMLAVLRLPAMFYVYLLLMFACGVLLECAVAANVLGGKPLRRWIPAALYFLTVMVPTLVTLGWGIGISDGAEPRFDSPGWHGLVCVALWLLWCAGFAALAWRGWHALRHRPHPFLANPPQ